MHHFYDILHHFAHRLNHQIIYPVETLKDLNAFKTELALICSQCQVAD